MKKIKCILSIILISAIIGIIFIFDIRQNQFINIEDDNLMWNLYDINIYKINENMNSISISGNTFEWEKLKELNTSDENYKILLNELFIKARTCYLKLESNTDLYTDNNYVKKYRNSNRITKKDLIDLKSMVNNDYIANFKYFKDIELNVEVDNKERILNKIDEIVNFNNQFYITNPENYNDFIYNQIIETEILKNISDFLCNEYYRLQ